MSAIIFRDAVGPHHLSAMTRGRGLDLRFATSAIPALGTKTATSPSPSPSLSLMTILYLIRLIKTKGTLNFNERL